MGLAQRIKTLADLPKEQNSGVQFPAPMTGNPSLPVTLIVRDSMPSSGLNRHLHTCGIHSTQNHTYTLIKAIFRRKLARRELGAVSQCVSQKQRSIEDSTARVPP